MLVVTMLGAWRAMASGADLLDLSRLQSRLRDFDAIDSRRGELGMSDGQIAARTGLSEAQVCWIRNHMEAKSARAGNFHRLLELGGGKRFRDERFTPHENRHRYSRAALELRESLRADPGLASRYVEQGWWGDHTLSGWLQHCRKVVHSALRLWLPLARSVS